MVHVPREQGYGRVSRIARKKRKDEGINPEGVGMEKIDNHDPKDERRERTRYVNSGQKFVSISLCVSLSLTLLAINQNVGKSSPWACCENFFPVIATAGLRHHQRG